MNKKSPGLRILPQLILIPYRNKREISGRLNICFCVLRFFSRKYAEAKQCAKNATLSLCNVTPGQRDEVNFMYDGFNPFCFNLSDPPAAEKSRGLGERVPRESGDQRPMEPSDPSTDAVLRGGGEQSVSATPLSLVVVMFMQVLRAAVS